MSGIDKLTQQEFDDLRTRVDQFQMLKLPGQPQMMHMGTSYLVGDLWRAIKRLQEASHADR
jgi:hypothetical protein